MNSKTPMTIPLWLMVLDAVGAILVGLGLAEWLMGTNLIPAALQFEDYDIVMIIVGAALMIPMFRHVIKSARACAGTGHRPG